MTEPKTRLVSVIVEIEVQEGYRDPLPGDVILWRSGVGDAKIVAIVPEVLSDDDSWDIPNHD